MTAILDIMGSMIVGGIILIIVINANTIMMENSSIYGGDLLVQELLVSTTSIIESEFRNMGYKVDADEDVIRKAEENQIWFLAGSPHSSSIDTIKYFTLTPESLAVNDVYVKNTENEMDRFLYRQCNNGQRAAVGTITFFRLSYFALLSETDSVLRKLTFPIDSDDMKRIAAVEIEIEVQNPYAIYKRRDDPTYDARSALYSSSMWRQTRLTSQNLRK